MQTALDGTRLSEAQLGDCVELTEIMSPAPLVVDAKTPLPKVIALFRGLGMRHLVVVDRGTGGAIQGIITRKDLLNVQRDH